MYYGGRGPNRALQFVVLGVAVAFFASLVVLAVLKWSALNAQFSMARSVPMNQTYALHIWTYALALPLMTLGALLPVVACIRALRGRSPAAALIIYAMLQFTLVIVHWASTAYLVNQGRYAFQNPPGTHRVIYVAEHLLSDLKMAHVLYSAPMFVLPFLLIPAVRRTLFPRPSADASPDARR